MEPVVKACQRGNFVRSGRYLIQFCVLGYTVNRHLLESGFI